MKIEIKKEHENKTINRREIELYVSESKTTPSRKELLEKIGDMLNQKPANLSIQKIEQQFGTQANRVWVHQYPDAATKQRFELAPLMGRDSATKFTSDLRKKHKAARQAIKDAGKPKTDTAEKAAAEKK
ncbi:MAG: hypothetical protein V1777_02625 [Candidatus Micrarchaeota archaeon]